MLWNVGLKKKKKKERKKEEVVRQKNDTVRSGAEERTFSEACLDVLIFRLRSYNVPNHVRCRW